MATPSPSGGGNSEDAPSPSSSSSSTNQQDPAAPFASGAYSGLAAKTVANIRRLQENVATTTTSGGGKKSEASSWAGNHQVLSPPSVPLAASSPVEADKQNVQQVIESFSIFICTF